MSAMTPARQSPVPFQRCDGIESSSKETPEDGLSTGCFTLDNRTNWKPECRVPTSLPAAEIEIKPEVSVFHEEKKMPSLWKLSDNTFAGRGVSLKGRRGKRKQKDCSKDVKEGSVGESEFLGSADVLSASRCKGSPTSIGDQSRSSSKDAVFDVSLIYFFFFYSKII